jgi:hypothetical protein
LVQWLIDDERWTMARNRNIPALDPATEKPLASGVTYRGPGQYRARKLVNGHRVTKTFATARFAGRWLTEIQVDSARACSWTARKLNATR